MGPKKEKSSNEKETALIVHLKYLSFGDQKMSKTSFLLSKSLHPTKETPYKCTHAFYSLSFPSVAFAVWCSLPCLFRWVPLDCPRPLPSHARCSGGRPHCQLFDPLALILMPAICMTRFSTPFLLTSNISFLLTVDICCVNECPQC